MTDIRRVRSSQPRGSPICQSSWEQFVHDRTKSVCEEACRHAMLAWSSVQPTMFQCPHLKLERDHFETDSGSLCHLYQPPFVCLPPCKSPPLQETPHTLLHIEGSIASNSTQTITILRVTDCPTQNLFIMIFMLHRIGIRASGHMTKKHLQYRSFASYQGRIKERGHATPLSRSSYVASRVQDRMYYI